MAGRRRGLRSACDPSGEMVPDGTGRRRNGCPKQVRTRVSGHGTTPATVGGGRSFCSRGRAASAAADPEDLAAADRAGALQRGLAVLHGDALCVLDFDLLLVLDAVGLSHRAPPGVGDASRDPLSRIRWCRCAWFDVFPGPGSIWLSGGPQR